MSADMQMFHEPNGPGYQVEPSVNWPELDHVGLIVLPERGRGWCELTPDEADQLAAILHNAADETRTRAEARTVAAYDYETEGLGGT